MPPGSRASMRCAWASEQCLSARLEGEVQPIVLGVAVLQRVDHAQALQVVLEAAVLGHALAQRVLPGVAEGRVAQVVRQGDGLDQVLVQTQSAGNVARQLCHLQRVRQARAEQIALVVEEHLRLVDQAAKRAGVHDAVAVALKGVARGRGRDRVPPAARSGRVAGVGSQSAGFMNQMGLQPASIQPK